MNGLVNMPVSDQRSSTRNGSGSPRRGAIGPALIALIGLAVVAAAVWMVWLRDGRSGGESGSAGGSEVFSVLEGSFDITVPAAGELAAFNQIEIRNPLEGNAVITFIAPEGSTVTNGDVLIRFADDEIRNDIKDAELEALTAKNAVTAAEKGLEIQISENDSFLKAAILAVELAELALEQWQKGEVESERQRLQLALETAERNVVRMTEKLVESAELVKQEFISKDEYKRDEIEKIEADAALAKAKLDKQIYEGYQYKRDLKQNESDVQQAKDELDRVKTQNDANLVKAQDDLATTTGQYEIRASRLADFKRQLENSAVFAPADGLVVYASSMESGGGMRGNDDQPPQVGTELRENELVIILPDVTQMVAAVMVHESISGRIRAGQAATVVPDSAQSTTLRGRVYNIGVLAQTGGWRDPNRRDYTVRIALEGGEGLDLKPSMRCKAEIFLDRVENATYVPVQAIFRDAGRAFVYVPEARGFGQRAVEFGRSSEIYVEVTEGLDPGEQVLLREPEPSEVVSKLPPLPPEQANGNTPYADAPGTGESSQGGGAPAGDGERGGPGGNRGGGPDFMAQFDGNGDGKLQKDEIPAQMQGMFDRLDANADGAIDAEEMESARGRMGGGNRDGGGDRGTGRGNEGRAGEPTGRPADGSSSSE